MPTSKPHLYFTGMAVGLDQLPGLLFDPNKPFAGCRICATVFQSEIDRHPLTPLQEKEAEEGRKSWSLSHAKQHSEREHRQLAESGLWCTPEAAFRFAAIGVIPVTDLINDETLDALRQSSPIPTDDCES